MPVLCRAISSYLKSRAHWEQYGMNRLIQKRLVDRMIEAYVDWAEASRLVNDAYRFWQSNAGCRSVGAFSRYSAALDQEERAAETYAGLVRRVGHAATLTAEAAPAARDSRLR
jgi:hypothetical protein